MGGSRLIFQAFVQASKWRHAKRSPSQYPGHISHYLDILPATNQTEVHVCLSYLLYRMFMWGWCGGQCTLQTWILPSQRWVLLFIHWRYDFTSTGPFYQLFKAVICQLKIWSCSKPVYSGRNINWPLCWCTEGQLWTARGVRYYPVFCPISALDVMLFSWGKHFEVKYSRNKVLELCVFI